MMASMQEKRHSIQPLVTDEHGVVRFKENKIVRDLLDFSSLHGRDMNAIARADYTREDREQFAQLIGYSWSGAHDLDYMGDGVLEVANARMHEQPIGSMTVDELRQKLDDAVAAVRADYDETQVLIARGDLHAVFSATDGLWSLTYEPTRSVQWLIERLSEMP